MRAPPRCGSGAPLILASMAARWNLTPQAGPRVTLAARAALVPKAFPVRLTARPGSDRNSLPVRAT